MTDERFASIDRFLGGEITLAELQTELQSQLVAAPAVGPAVAAYLDSLYQQGRLPFRFTRC